MRRQTLGVNKIAYVRSDKLGVCPKPVFQIGWHIENVSQIWKKDRMTCIHELKDGNVYSCLLLPKRRRIGRSLASVWQWFSHLVVSTSDSRTINPRNEPSPQPSSAFFSAKTTAIRSFGNCGLQAWAYCGVYRSTQLSTLHDNKMRIRLTGQIKSS